MKTSKKEKRKKEETKPKPSTKKIEKIKRKAYNKEFVQKALDAIKCGMSKRLAAKTFQIPRSTLQFKTKFPNKRSRPGPATVLTDEEELLLEKWVLECARKGFPKRKEDLLASVSEFIRKNNRPNPFKDGVPGEKWYKLFLNRHPKISVRTPEAVTSASAVISEEDIRGWFLSLKDYYKQKQLEEAISHSERIFNGDETNFMLCPKTGVVLAERGEKNVYEIDVAPAKTAITVLFTFGADGSLTPPLVIYPYKRLPTDIASKVPSDWGIGLSDNGWMKAEIFKDYLRNIFHPYLVKKGTKFPVILYVDGHKTHVTYEVSETCTSLQIELVALYPNCTRILQPADVAAFKPLKSGWKKTVLAWRRDHPAEALSKQKFAPLLQDTIKKTVKRETIINGFRTTGLFPFDQDAIDYSKCLGKKNTAPTQGEQENVSSSTVTNVTMSESDLRTIIGEKKWKSLQDGNDPDVDESLRKIWNFFQYPKAQEKYKNQKSTDQTNNQDFRQETKRQESTEQTKKQESTKQTKNQNYTQETKNKDSIEQTKNQNSTEQAKIQASTEQTENRKNGGKTMNGDYINLDDIERMNVIFMDNQENTNDFVSHEIVINETETDYIDAVTEVRNMESLSNDEDSHSSFVILTDVAQIHATNDGKIESCQETIPKIVVQSIEYCNATKDFSVTSKAEQIPGSPKKREDACKTTSTIKAKLTPVKLDDILVLRTPSTPKRKGTKTTKRVPFAVTSNEWKEQEMLKRKEKEEKIEGVKRRKEERERKKLEKENIKKEKQKQKQSKPKPSINKTKREETNMVDVSLKPLYDDAKQDSMIRYDQAQSAKEVNDYDSDCKSESDDLIVRKNKVFFTEAEIEKALWETDEETDEEKTD